MTHASRYVRDTAYFSAFVPAQAPCRLSVAALLAGAPAPDFRQPFRYLDLCCGDGVTLATLAACYPHARFVGVDFDPDAVARARSLTEATGLKNVDWIVSDVAALEADARAFDYICLVGAFSWLDDPRRQAVLRLVADRLATEGLFLLHYASKPGAVQTETLHQALRLLAPEAGTSDRRMVTALESLGSGDLTAFRKSHPLADDHLKALAQAPAAFAQEALSPDSRAFWQPEIENRLAQSGLMPLAEAEDVEPIWLADEAPQARTLRAMRRDFERNRLSRLDICKRTGEPDLQRARDQLLSLEWTGPGPAPGFGALAPEDGPHWPAAVAAAREAVRRSTLHPLVRRTAPALRPARLSPFNRYALEESLLRPSPLPLASTALGTQVVMPLRHRLQLYALMGGDAASLLGRASPHVRVELEDCLRPEDLASFQRDALPRLIRLGVVGD